MITTSLKRPRLSVVMPMRNCADSVCTMLGSLPYREIAMQIVVVDDASEDGSAERVAAWSEKSGQSVVLLRNDKRLYSYTSRLKGWAQATAPIVWSIDADDRIPPNADILTALEIMEREQVDILHCKACGVARDSNLQQPLTWTEPIAEELHGSDILSIFFAQNYPPTILWNKFFSARLVKAVLEAAPAIEVRYFDIKFLGLLFLLYAHDYKSCNSLVYEYRMRDHRPSWLYVRQVDALLRLENNLSSLIKTHAPGQLESFLAYCRRRLVIQTGHLSIMAEAELTQMVQQRSDVSTWFTQNIWTNISRRELLQALCSSLHANAKRLSGWATDLFALCSTENAFTKHVSKLAAPQTLISAAQELLNTDNPTKVRDRLARHGFEIGLCLADDGNDMYADKCSDELIVALLLANAQLARKITAIMAPGTDITKKAN